MNEQKTSNTTPGLQANGGRRRFLGKGAAVAPAVLTLASQPALGVTCFTPSRSLSKNTSASQAGKDGQCTSTKRPTDFNSSWPTSVCAANTPFHPYFSGSLKNNANGTSKTMKAVLAANQTDLAAYVITAALNIKLGLVPVNVLTETVVKAMWTKTSVSGGYYEPTAGVKWFAAEVINYFKTNGIVGPV
ncbi:hypothetical protein LNV09_03055 [Paucibacter sp. B2R-40]|uniref:hypothetical protein n=1 Tax=Paucibacter sp. B2R-40 TaxID=2893554 RepID=UPI0021E440C4|nr:hypothetical protein [Paucibacter sp. B2R-40]MCV2353137.1 hypothetical protein [Paucibacter sp. B2R-40]